jgi:hypothetical protein
VTRVEVNVAGLIKGLIGYGLVALYLMYLEDIGLLIVDWFSR